MAFVEKPTSTKISCVS